MKTVLRRKMANKKIKPILPSLREKKRYLGFEVISKAKLTNFEAVSAEIVRNTSKLLGDLNMAKAGIYIFPDKFKDNKGIIKVNNKYLDHLKASLALSKMQMRSIGVSGMINKIEKKLAEV